MDVNVAIALVGVSLAVASFYLGRQTASRDAGIEEGSLHTDLQYIKESVARIERRLNDDINRLEGRIDEISKQIMEIAGLSSKAYESTKSAHRRLDEHLERDHGQILVRRKEGN